MTEIHKYRQCDCDWRPKCEALGPCGEYAVTSEWKPDYATKRWWPVWLCGDHLDAWRERPEKLAGITKPRHADEDWRPSIMDHVRLSVIASRQEQQRNDQPPTVIGIIANHQRGWTKQQWANHAAMLEGMRRAAR